MAAKKRQEILRFFQTFCFEVQLSWGLCGLPFSPGAGGKGMGSGSTWLHWLAALCPFFCVKGVLLWPWLLNGIQSLASQGFVASKIPR